MSIRLAHRVLARYLEANGLRQEVHRLTKSINPARGFSRETLRDYVKTEPVEDDTVVPSHTDIRPEDVFTPKPRNMAVLNSARGGWPGTPRPTKIWSTSLGIRFVTTRVMTLFPISPSTWCVPRAGEVLNP